MPPPALLIPGGRGQLGTDLVGRRGPSGLVHAPGSSELDITDSGALTDAVDSFADAAGDAGLRPVVVNLAAYTAVDDAESDPAGAERVNTRGPAELAEVCRKRGLPLLHVSTDYVFRGDASVPYEPDDETGPRSVYGRTKLAGERAVLAAHPRAWVVRTAWLYGVGGTNFVSTMARLCAERETISVAEDQVGSPTWTADLAGGLLELADSVARRDEPAARVLHCTNTGSVNRCEFARAVFEELGADPERVRPVATADVPRPAPRPAFSVLSDRKWTEGGLTPLRPWREALRAAFERHGAVWGAR
ncbi:dTDP-4-dehydrorhamnose reductase [Actinopolyspora erythraea]|uniref:dTDP-4-dehydrorhamnose reductase n=1 Tax=Actinopolyspora erythraea TaxID=414996 RepID=A0A099D429_9ACTN|nr:dTDP-4-dehydrorhamnose reductase [Actinopolyspora erythraea]ASU77627.1 dTDP-4-dehydrorhamnose reductase [Actinopolyspora erythraea]KGI80537.1 dTDP-4-dehydrorhamnose reductase [Actinopolyspora erythraea]